MGPRQIAVGAVVLVVFAAGVYLLANAQPSAPTPAATSSEKAAEVPPLTPAMEAILAKSNGFQYLVSYTDGGFEPATLDVKKGETVRFTNNSQSDLWIAETPASGSMYPSTGDECGQSAFDSCIPLKPQEFWEFTFDAAGTWSYKNNSDAAKTGVITVQ